METPTRKATFENRRKVRDLLATGHTPREIALQLGITTQAVYQHMDALKKAAKDEGAA